METRYRLIDFKNMLKIKLIFEMIVFPKWNIW